MELHDSLANLAIRPITILDISAPLLFAIIILSGLRVSEVNEICSTFKNVLATRLRNSPIALDLDQMHEHGWLRKVVLKLNVDDLMKIDLNMKLSSTFTPTNNISGVLSTNGDLTWKENPCNFPTLTNVKIFTKAEYPPRDPKLEVQKFLAICGENRYLCCFSKNTGSQCITYADQIQSFVSNDRGEIACLKNDGTLQVIRPTGDLLDMHTEEIEKRGGVKTIVGFSYGFLLLCHDGSFFTYSDELLSHGGFKCTNIASDRSNTYALVSEDAKETRILLEKIYGDQGQVQILLEIGPENRVEQILGMFRGYAVRMTDGSVITWWRPYTNDEYHKGELGTADKIYATENIFAALKKNTLNGVFFLERNSKKIENS